MASTSRVCRPGRTRVAAESSREASYSASSSRREKNFSPSYAATSDSSSSHSAAKRMRRELRNCVLAEEPDDLRRRVRELEEVINSDKFCAKRHEFMHKEVVSMLRSQVEEARKEIRRKETALEEARRDADALRKRVERAELAKAKAESVQTAARCGEGTSECIFHFFVCSPVLSYLLKLLFNCYVYVCVGAGTACAGADNFFEDVMSNFKELLDSNLQCSICSELFICPVVAVKCGHTFCEECIKEWMARKESSRGNTRPRCPICRGHIREVVLNLGLESFLEKAVDNFLPQQAKAIR